MVNARQRCPEAPLTKKVNNLITEPNVVSNYDLVIAFVVVISVIINGLRYFVTFIIFGCFLLLQNGLNCWVVLSLT